MIDFHNKRVMVTGGTSMVGSAIVRCLKHFGPTMIDPVPHKHCDLLNKDEVERRFLGTKPDYVIHCAGWNGGISFNQKFPHEIFYRTTMMGLNVLNASHKFGVEKVVSLIPSCSYPSGKEILRETEFWDGKSHDSVECHGLAKRNLLAYGNQLNKVSTTKFVSVVLNNCYGVGDSFDPDKTKVVGATIKKFVDSDKNAAKGSIWYNPADRKVTCWGDGLVRRELIYCDDAAEGVLRTLLDYDDPILPLNIGWGTDITIRQLYETVASLTGFDGEIIYDDSKPNGQMVKLLDVQRMQKILNWKPQVSLESGLQRTIDYYRKHYT